MPEGVEHILSGNEPMEHGTERNHERWESLTPEQRMAVERVKARSASPESRAAEARAAALDDRDAPNAAGSLDMIGLLRMLRAERERQGLSLTDAAARSGIEKSFLSKLELGKVANPTVGTLRGLAEALGLKLVFALGFDPALKASGGDSELSSLAQETARPGR